MSQAFEHTCPHCGRPQKMPLAQRCQSCRLNMMSDRSFASWQAQLAPALTVLTQAAEGEDPDLDWALIQPAIETLTPWVDEFPGLQTALELIRPRLMAQLQTQKRRQQLWLHGFLWVVLALVPLFAAFFEAPLEMTLLLLLPVLGWGWLGIRPLWKQRGAGILVLLCLSQGLLAAQEASAERYQAALTELASQVAGPVKRLAGLRRAEDYSLFKVDTSATAGLLLLAPRVQYTRLAKDQYLREVTARATLGDSLPLQAVRQDTLRLAQLKQVRAESPPDLMGLDPRPWARWGKPGLLVGGSILGVLSFFYVRSIGS